MFPAPKLIADSLFATWNLQDEVAAFAMSSGTRLLTIVKARKCLHNVCCSILLSQLCCCFKKRKTLTAAIKTHLGNGLCCDCDLLSLRKINTLFSGTRAHVQSSKNIYSIFRGRRCLFVYFSVKGFSHLSKYYHVFTYCGFGNIFLDNIGIRLLWTTHRLLPRPLVNARLPTHQVWKTDHWPPLEPAAHRPRKPAICLDDLFHFWFFPFMASALISPISFASFLAAVVECRLSIH